MTNITLKVKTSELNQTAMSIHRKIKTTKNQFDEMQKIIDDSQYYWEGDANNVHRQEYNQYKDDILEIIARLSEHVTDLQEMAGVYETTENQVKDIIEELPNDVII